MDCGLLWCFYQTLILTAPIHCRASIEELVKFLNNREILFNFWVNYSFKGKKYSNYNRNPHNRARFPNCTCFIHCFGYWKWTLVIFAHMFWRYSIAPVVLALEMTSLDVSLFQVWCCLLWPPVCISSPSWACAPGGPSAARSIRFSSAVCVSWWPSSVQDTSSYSTSTSSSSSRRPFRPETRTPGETHVLSLFVSRWAKLFSIAQTFVPPEQKTFFIPDLYSMHTNKCNFEL